jgi:hypothetical protein
MAFFFNGSVYNRFTGGLLTTNPTEYTYTCWIKIHASGNGCIIQRSNGNPLSAWSHLIRYDAGNNRFTAYTYTNGGPINNGGPSNVVLNRWYHIATSAKDNDTFMLYVNGEPTTPTSMTGLYLWSGGNDYWIGRTNGNGDGNLTNCSVSNLALYYKKHSDDFIKRLAQGTIRDLPITSNASNLALYLPMNDKPELSTIPDMYWYDRTRLGYTQTVTGTITCVGDILSS